MRTMRSLRCDAHGVSAVDRADEPCSADFIRHRQTQGQAKKWRISEKTLLLTGFLGGAAGALLGMRFFRHKTKHWYFWAVNLLGLVLHIAAGIVIWLKTASL